MPRPSSATFPQMDVNSDSVYEELSQSSVLSQMSGNSTIRHSGHLAPCALCQRFLSSDDGAGDSQAVSFCGDCKFLILEDVGIPIQDDHRRTQRLRRRRYRRSDSMNFFSQQVSHMITRARQNQAAVLEQDNESREGDSATPVFQRSSSQTTPSESRRWRRVLSDTESDVLDSLYGDSESNVSFSGSRIFPGESDTISYSAYGGDSDTSVDGHSFLENENYVHLAGLSGPETDTDIDPMNAGLYHWNSDDLEEDNEDDENSEWEETDAEENTVASLGLGGRLHRNFDSSESNITSDQRQILSPEIQDTTYLTAQGRIRRHIANAFTTFEQTEGQNYTGYPRDYLGLRGFEELLEHLAETDSSRRVAPPAAISFVDNLPCVVIHEDHGKVDGLACAICKDTFSVGTIVNQLPCLHIYHPSCILPWLSARNSCPLCRFELPTDDQDYENKKQGSGSILDIQEIQQQDMDEDVSSYLTEGAEVEFGHNWLDCEELDNVNLVTQNSGRESARRWFFLAAAAPVVGIVGIALAFCLGNPMTHIRWSSSGNNFNTLRQHPSLCLDIHPSIQRNNGRNRRWWFPF